MQNYRIEMAKDGATETWRLTTDDNAAPRHLLRSHIGNMLVTRFCGEDVELDVVMSNNRAALATDAMASIGVWLILED